MKWMNLVALVATLSLIQSCANVEPSQNSSSLNLVNSKAKAPNIPINPEDASFPLRVNPEGKIMPSYQWDECPSYPITCTLGLKKWKTHTEFIELDWFLEHDYVLTKRRKPEILK